MQEAITKIDHVRTYLHDNKPAGFEGQMDTLSEAQQIIEREAQKLTDALETRVKKVQELSEKLENSEAEMNRLADALAALKAPSNTNPASPTLPPDAPVETGQLQGESEQAAPEQTEVEEGKENAGTGSEN